MSEERENTNSVHINKEFGSSHELPVNEEGVVTRQTFVMCRFEPEAAFVRFERCIFQDCPWIPFPPASDTRGNLVVHNEKEEEDGS